MIFFANFSCRQISGDYLQETKKIVLIVKSGVGKQK